MSAKRESLKILLFTDDGDKHPANPDDAKKYNLIMSVDYTSDPWEAVAEMLTEAGISESKYLPDQIEIDIEGAIGLKSVEKVKTLAAHGQVTWKIDAKSVDPVKHALGDLIKVEVFRRGTA